MTKNTIEVTSRICSVCKIEKQFSEFSKNKTKKYGVNNACKKCVLLSRQNEKDRAYNREYQAEYRKNYPEKVAELNKKWRHSNSDYLRDKKREYHQENAKEIKIRKREYSQKNKEKIRESKRRYHKENARKISEKMRTYRKLNAKKLNEKKRQYLSERANSDNFFAIKMRIRALISTSIRSKGYTKKSRTHEILGCDYQTFANHLESQFKDGMNWDNRSEWHIDHIIPLASAKTESELIALNHFSNLQPLWAIDNLKKGAKMPHELI